MITVHGSVPFPPTNPEAQTAFGASCTTLAKALKGASTQVASTTNAASSTWTGVTATSFVSHMMSRSQGLSANAASLAKVETIMSTYAKAMTAAENAYTKGALDQIAALSATIFSEAAEAIAIGEQMLAVAELEMAGGVCAVALLAVIAQLGIQEVMAFDTGLVAELEKELGNVVTGVATAVGSVLPQQTGTATAIAPAATVAAKPTTIGGYLALAKTAEDMGPGTIAVMNTGNNNWVVSSPGIQSITSTAQNQSPQTGMDTIQQMATGTSADEAAVKDALQKAGVPQGANIMFVGHSQFGLTSFDLANDPSFTSQYNVTHIFTAGSPIGDSPSPAGTQTLSLMNNDDLIPHLNNTSDSVNHPTVQFDDLAGPTISANHDIQNVYVNEANSPEFTSNPQTVGFSNSASAYLQPGSATVQYFTLTSSAAPALTTPINPSLPAIQVQPPMVNVQLASAAAN